MKNRMTGLALAAGLMAAGTANAADYYIVSRIRDLTVAVELSTVKKTGSVASAMVTMARAEPFQIGGKSVAYIVSAEEFDCQKHVTRTVSPSLFLADGSLMVKIEEPTEWKSIIPESQADLMLRATCDPASRDAALVEQWAGPRDLVADYRRRLAAGTID